MAIRLLACGCPCSNAEDPCDCCPCVTNPKIYSNINFSSTGSGNGYNQGGVGNPGPPFTRKVNYVFNQQTSINSLITPPPVGGGYPLTCENCPIIAFDGNGSNDGSASISMNYSREYDLAAGIEIGRNFGSTENFSCAGLEECFSASGGPFPCPYDVCLDGQMIIISNTAPPPSTEELSVGCGNNPYSVIWQCGQWINYGEDPVLFSSSLTICPKTNALYLQLTYSFGAFGNLGFVITNDPTRGQKCLGGLIVNDSEDPIDLYVEFYRPADASLMNVVATANIVVEYDSGVVVRNPETGECII